MSCNNENQNILKVRDDRSYMCLEYHNENEEFTLTDSASPPSWVKDGKIKLPTLRERIEPWLTALVQSEHLNLLIGTGLSYAVHHVAAGESFNWNERSFSGPLGEIIESGARSIAEKRYTEDIGHITTNFEDRLRVALEIWRGLRHQDQEAAQTLKDEINRIIQVFTEDVLKLEKGLISAETQKRDVAFRYLVRFLMSFASRFGARDRLHIFTTNYDRFIEMGADLAGLRLLDRFVGAMNPVFRATRLEIDYHYTPPGGRGEHRYLEGVARFTKLHGSLDWVEKSRGIVVKIPLPFGAGSISPYLGHIQQNAEEFSHIMIYPNDAKDLETTEYPYTELFRDFAAALCRPNTTLFTYGYGFGDEHINRIIEDMLTIPSTHLVIISRSDRYGRMFRFYERFTPQVTLLIGKQLGDLRTLVDEFLPKPAIDWAMIRMTELLERRLGRHAQSAHPSPEQNNTVTEQSGET